MLARRTTDRAIERLYRVFAFSVPFAIIAVPLGAYLFSVATFLLLCLDLLLVLRGRFLAGPLVSVAVFLAWCLLTAVGRLEVRTYLFSFLALASMLIPVTASITDAVRSQKVLQALVYGLIGSFILGAYQVGVNAGLPPLVEFFNAIGLGAAGGTGGLDASVYFGFHRVQSAHTEPAHYAHYLVFSYALIDQADQRGIRVLHPRLIRGTIVFFIFATVSLSGLIMFFGYLGLVGLIEWRQRILGKLFSINFWGLVPLLVMVGLLISEYYGQGIWEYILWTYSRIEDAITAIQLGLVKGSEASRARSATIFIEYWDSQDWWTALVGEGYGNQSEWLIQNYGHLKGTSFARGSVHNNFAYIGITTGVIGIILYLCFIVSLIRKRSGIPLAVFGVWIIGHFAMGYLTFYRFWWPLILGAAIFDRRKTKA